MTKIITLIEPIIVGTPSEVRIVTEFSILPHDRNVAVALPNTSHIGFTYHGCTAANFDVVVLRFYGAGVLGQSNPTIPFCYVIFEPLEEM